MSNFKLKWHYKREDYLRIYEKGGAWKKVMSMTFRENLQNLTHGNKLLHSIFSNCKVFLIKTTKLQLQLTLQIQVFNFK